MNGLKNHMMTNIESLEEEVVVSLVLIFQWQKDILMIVHCLDGGYNGMGVKRYSSYVNNKIDYKQKSV